MDFVTDFLSGLEPTTALIVAAVWSLFFVPLTFFGPLKLHTKFVVQKHNAQLRARDEPMTPMWVKLKPRMVFASRDKRAVFPKKGAEEVSEDDMKPPFFNRRLLYWILLLSSLISTPVLFYLGMYTYGLIASPVLFYAFLIYGLNSPVKIMAKREALLSNMVKIVRSNIGIEKEYESNPTSVISVVKWAPDFITPLKIDILVPAQFNASGQLPFLEQFNQVYGRSRTWVARNDDGSSGWNFEEGRVRLYAVPPIPSIAPWHERYVLTEGIAWSFFPVGLGAENGVELTNPETGKKEYVLGFDLAGEQSSYGKKHGLKVGSEIVTSPMVLVGGGTGGGKALDTETPIIAMTKEEKPVDTPDSN